MDLNGGEWSTYDFPIFWGRRIKKKQIRIKKKTNKDQKKTNRDQKKNKIQKT